MADCSRIELDWGSMFVQQHAVQVKRHMFRIERNAGITGCRNDSSPVGIGTRDGCFYQRTVRDGLSDLQGVVTRSTAVDLNRDEMGCPFSVSRNGLSEVFTHLNQRCTELVQGFSRKRRSAYRTVG